MRNDIVTYLKTKQNKKKASFLLSYSIVISKKKNKIKHSPQAPGQYRKADGMGVLIGRGEIIGI